MVLLSGVTDDRSSNTTSGAWVVVVVVVVVVEADLHLLLLPQGVLYLLATAEVVGFSVKTEAVVLCLLGNRLPWRVEAEPSKPDSSLTDILAGLSWESPGSLYSWIAFSSSATHLPFTQNWNT